MPVGWGNALSGLLQGFAQGRQQAEENQRKREELELKKKQADLQIKQHDIESKIKEQQLKDMLRRGQIGDQMEMEARGGLVAPGTEIGPRMEGGDFYSQPDQVAAQRKTPSIQQILTAEAVRGLRVPTELLRPDPIETLLKLNQAVQGQAATGTGQTGGTGQTSQPATPAIPFQGPAFPQGATPGITAGGRITLRGNAPQREGVGVEAQTWNRIIKENPGKSLAELREIYNLETRRTAEARGTGAQEGALGVRQRPDYLQNRTDVAAATARGGEAVKAQERLVGMSGTSAVINQIEDIAKRLLTAEPGLDRFVKGAQNKAGAMLQTNEDAVALDNLRNSYSNILSRSILAEKGVITDRDRQFATDAIPSLFDSKKVAQNKIALFRSLNTLIMDAEERVASGQPLDIKALRAKLDAMQGGSKTGTSTQPPTNRPPPPPGFRY